MNPNETETLNAMREAFAHIRRLESALRVARGYVLSATSGDRFTTAIIESDLQTIDTALGIEQ